jgi:hypothetical protein
MLLRVLCRDVKSETSSVIFASFGVLFGAFTMAQGQHRSCRLRTVFAQCCCFLAFANLLHAAETKPDFEKDVRPILKNYCYDCHGDGASKGKVAFDEFKSHAELIAARDTWAAALKNTRAGIMPPAKKPRPTAAEQHVLETWIKREVFQIDPQNLDPGRVTIRRLNRVEYRNTIRDLMGYDFKVEDELPPDDSGYGFDNIGDVLTISPLLLEKYMQAAEQIIAAAVPRHGRVPGETVLIDNEPKRGRGRTGGERTSFYDTAKLTRSFNAPHDGSYRIELAIDVLGQFDFDPGRCRLVLNADGANVWSNDFKWHDNKRFNFELPQKWSAGKHSLVLELQPLTPAQEKKNSLDLRIAAMRVVGPLEDKFLVAPKNYERFFWKDPPTDATARREYAREVLSRFAKKAYRRPVDERTINRLVSIAENVYREPGKRFEDGIAQAMIPLLASPKFLFRIEEAQPSSADKYPLIDEYALASRLSYFLWSTMPDEELFRVADRGELRKNLDAQLKRMATDERAESFVHNFVGQWLQVRDVEGIDINPRVVLARDRGEDRDMRRRFQRIQELREIPEEKRTAEQKAELETFIAQRRQRQRRPNEITELDRDLRRFLRDETFSYFNYVMREDRSVLELIDSNYTFLNDRLARYYGFTNLNLGPEMKRVEVPAESRRGGVLTQGSILIVTSNPTRTSPVKRGLFILDNILGTPTPPPPPDIPPLEASEKESTNANPTLRETLAIHREKPLCSSCHNRMDPLGLALENFNALGMWRDKERGKPVDAGGKLITGETFTDVREVKHVLATKHKSDFYRCLTEKMLIYALGRGLEYSDVESVDRIVQRLEQENGRFSALLTGIVESVPFQRTRLPEKPAVQQQAKN